LDNNHHAAIGGRHNAAIMEWTVSQQDQTRAKRLETLRSAMAAARFDGWIIGREDMYQGEEVPAGDERLAYLSGFTGSAGFAVVLGDRAGLFSDGRYSLQMPAQTNSADWDCNTIPDVVQSSPLMEGWSQFQALDSLKNRFLRQVEHLFVTTQTCLISNGMIGRLCRQRQAGRCRLKMPVSHLPKRAMILPPILMPKIALRFC
jgi:hypothetical protein